MSTCQARARFALCSEMSYSCSLFLVHLLVRLYSSVCNIELTEAELISLCGRPDRPHYGSCPSVLLSVRPSRMDSLILKQKGIENPNWCERSPGLTGLTVFSSKGQRSGGRPRDYVCTGPTFL